MKCLFGKTCGLPVFETFNRAMCIAIAFLFSANFSLRAQTDIPAESDAAGAKIQQTPEFKDFIDKYIAAVNAKNMKALRALYDPVSQAAMAKDEKDATVILHAAVVDAKIPAEHEVVVSMVGPKEPLMFEEAGAVYAVRPAALVQIRYSMAEASSSSIFIYAAQAGNRWYEVWSNPPDPKKMEAEMESETKAEPQPPKEQEVKASGITDFQHDTKPKDEFTKPYRWVAHLTGADSKDRKYEVVQIDKSPDGTTKTKVVVESGMVRPDHGTYGVQVGLSDKASAGTGNMAEMFGLQEDISLSCVDASNGPTGVGASAFVSLPGPTMTGINASPAGTPLNAVVSATCTVTGLPASAAPVTVTGRLPFEVAPEAATTVEVACCATAVGHAVAPFTFATNPCTNTWRLPGTQSPAIA